MHPYSIDTEERKNVLLFLALMSILLAWGFSNVLEYYQIHLSWWIESPSVLFFYGAVFLIFDRFVWKPLAKMQVIKTPNLNGEWHGNLKSSRDGHTKEIKVTLKIFQTWTDIKILLISDSNVSQSESAAVISGEPEGKYLNYQYVVEPKPNSVKDISIHRGTARLFFEEKNMLEGDYYTGRGSQNFGSLRFAKGSKKQKSQV